MTTLIMRSIGVCLSVLLLANSVLADEHITAQHFNYTAPLLGGGSSLRQVELPAQVLENMTRQDMGDLRVFSAQGQLVPHHVIRGVTQQQENTSALRFYPFTRQQATDPAAIRLRIEQTGATQKIELDSEAAQNANQPAQEFQYIIENTISQAQRHQPLCGLTFAVYHGI